MDRYFAFAFDPARDGVTLWLGTWHGDEELLSTELAITRSRLEIVPVIVVPPVGGDGWTTIGQEDNDGVGPCHIFTTKVTGLTIAQTYTAEWRRNRAELLTVCRFRTLPTALLRPSVPGTGNEAMPEGGTNFPEDLSTEGKVRPSVRFSAEDFVTTGSARIASSGTPVLKNPGEMRKMNRPLTWAEVIDDFDDPGADPYAEEVEEVSARGLPLSEVERLVLEFPETTVPEVPSRFRILTGSCFWYRRSGLNHLDNLVDFLRDESLLPDLNILTGDQVYIDQFPWDWVRTTDDGNLQERITRRYWSTWRKLKSILQLAPNILVTDDHEFWNDYPYAPVKAWLALQDDEFRSNVERHCRDFAESVQRAKPRTQFSIGDDISFFIADTRLRRTETQFLPVDEFDRLLTWIANLQSPGVLVSSQPLMDREAGYNNYLGITDRKMPAFYEQYYRLTEAIRDAPHDILLISGDIHFGRLNRAAWTQPDGQERRFYELTSSPLRLLTGVPFLDERGWSPESLVWDFPTRLTVREVGLLHGINDPRVLRDEGALFQALLERGLDLRSIYRTDPVHSPYAEQLQLIYAALDQNGDNYRKLDIATVVEFAGSTPYGGIEATIIPILLGDKPRELYSPRVRIRLR